MINTKLTIDGTEYSDYTDLRLTRSTQENIATSNFSLNMPSPFGKHKNDFNIGDEVIIYADKDTSPATTKIFTGIIERINFSGQENQQKVNITGRDYSLRMMDNTVEPVVYTDSEVSTIVQNIIDNEVSDITTNNINVTTTTLERISFNHNTVYDAINQLAQLSGFIWYIDADKDLHFEEAESTSSGQTLNNTNIISTNFNTTKEGMANEVWVYGDRQLSGFKEIQQSDGGSVFTLVSKPRNTDVDYLGSSLKGGIWQLTNNPVSGVDYYVDFDAKNIIFVSGTDYGDGLIPSGGSFIINYDRDVPIVKLIRDNSSINQYGVKTKVIVDKNISSPLLALKTAQEEIKNSSPFRGLEIKIKGWYSLIPGNTIDVVLEDFNLSETGLSIISVDYDFSNKSVLDETVIKVRVDKKINDVTDKIKDMDERLRRLEAQDIYETEYLTRYEQATGSCLVVGSSWKVFSRTLDSGLGFILGNGSYAILGTNTLGYSGGLPSFGVVASGGYY